jgi:hypothetical protein
LGALALVNQFDNFLGYLLMMVLDKNHRKVINKSNFMQSERGQLYRDTAFYWLIITMILNIAYLVLYASSFDLICQDFDVFIEKGSSYEAPS